MCIDCGGQIIVCASLCSGWCGTRGYNIKEDMKEEEGKKTPTDFVKVIKECLIFYTTFVFALVAIFR